MVLAKILPVIFLLFWGCASEELRIQKKMEAELDRILVGRSRDSKDSVIIVVNWTLYYELKRERRLAIARAEESVFGDSRDAWLSHADRLLSCQRAILYKIEKEYGTLLAEE